MSRRLTPLPKIQYLSERVISILGCNPGPLALLGTNTYLVGTGKDRILIDTGDPGVREYQALLQQVLDETKSVISKIIITHHHPDHIGGLADVRKMLKANIPAYKFDFSTAELREKCKYVDGDIEFIQDKSSFSVEGSTLTAHYNPGHCDDHMILWMEEEKALFSADTILGEGTTKFENLSKYMKSLKDIKDMQPSVIYPSHGPIVKDPAPHIDYYIKHRQEREDQVYELLQASSHSAQSIVKILYKDYPEDLHQAAEGVILLQLEKLMVDGKISCHGDQKHPSSQWTIQT